LVVPVDDALVGYHVKVNGALIQLDRAAGGRTDKLRAYKVLLDGVKVARIRRGETRTLEVSPGHHELRLAVDWCRSPIVRLDLMAGQEARLRCWPKANPLTGLYRATLGWATYIGLEVVEITEAGFPPA
jgi:hypothetical protein